MVSTSNRFAGLAMETPDDEEYGSLTSSDDPLLGERLREFAAIEGFNYKHLLHIFTGSSEDDSFFSATASGSLPPRKRPGPEPDPSCCCAPDRLDELKALRAGLCFIAAQLRSIMKASEALNSTQGVQGTQLQQFWDSLSMVDKKLTSLQAMGQHTAPPAPTPQSTTRQPNLGTPPTGSSTPRQVQPAPSPRQTQPASPPTPSPSQPPPPPARHQRATSPTPTGRYAPPTPVRQPVSTNATTPSRQPQSSHLRPEAAATETHNSRRSPTTFEDPWNRKARALGVPYSPNPDDFQKTLDLLRSTIQHALGVRDPVILNIQPIGKPVDSKKFPGTTIISVQIEFLTVWACRAALRGQPTLKHQHIRLVEEIPDALRPERTHRLHLLKQLPVGSLPARVYGVDFYYLPPPDHYTSHRHEFCHGKWVWVPSFEVLKERVAQPCTPAVAAQAACPAQTPSAPRPQHPHQNPSRPTSTSNGRASSSRTHVHPQPGVHRPSASQSGSASSAGSPRPS